MHAGLKRLWRAGIDRSPRENLHSLRAKARQRFSHERTRELNRVVPDLQFEPVLGALAVSRLPASFRVVGLLGSGADAPIFRTALMDAGIRPVDVEWDPDDMLNLTDRLDALLVCEVPTSSRHWQMMKRLREVSPVRVIGVYELLLPFTAIQSAQSLLPYYPATSRLSSIAPFYLGREYFGPIDRLDEALPLSGKSLIEYGPMDGCMTAGLVAAGVDRLVAIEARAENFIKTLIACHVFGWNSVELVMDDFHNADGTTYGRFDLVFAHGVYYHSVAPFILFQNMLSMSDNIFIGGFCATDELPAGPYQNLRYEGREYRVKEHDESGEPVTGGVNATGYYFHMDDLIGFFRDEGCDVTLLSDDPSEVAAGRYVRFLARRKQP